MLAAVLLCLLGACSSTTFVYNRLDSILPWYLDDYVDLNNTLSILSMVMVTGVMQSVAKFVSQTPERAGGVVEEEVGRDWANGIPAEPEQRAHRVGERVAHPVG